MSKFYFFHGDKYCRYDAKADTVEAAYLPDYASTTDEWSGLPAGVDAALNWGNGKTYFFAGSEYYRYDNKNDRVDDDPSYPLPIVGNWKGLTLDPKKRVDACLKWDKKTAYFFQGENYWAYDLVNDKTYPNYPRKIAGNWPPIDHANILGKLSDFDFHHNLDAAVNWGNGKAYFFKGNKYLRYNMNPKNEGVDKLFPKDINDKSANPNWPGLFQTGVRAPVMLGYAGFDRMDYPGDAQMQQLWDETNLSWCGFYLNPAPSHNNVRDNSWMDVRPTLPIMTHLPALQNIGWKTAPIYVGQQPPDAPGRHNANAAQGTHDAGHAATLAIAAGYPADTIIYLDIEPSKKKLQNAMLEYYTNWVGGISTLGFRPGVYCPFQYVATLLGRSRAPAFWVVNGSQFRSGLKNKYQDPFPAPEPLLTTTPVASAWQLALDVTATVGNRDTAPWDFDSCSYRDPSSIP